MHFYIDESGIFNNPSNKDNIASCVAALVIPSSKKKEVFKHFERLTYGWATKGDEIKGKDLDEVQIAMIVSMLKKYDILLEINVIDLGIHTEQEITKVKQRKQMKLLKQSDLHTMPRQ